MDPAADPGAAPARGIAGAARRAVAGVRQGPAGPVLSGLGWNTLAQVTTVAINLALTPFLLLHIGTTRYGLYALLSSFTGLVSNLDAGIGPTATQYFAVAAGAGDRRATSSLLATLSLASLAAVGLLTGTVALLAPDLTGVLHGTAGIQHTGAVLLRVFMPLLFAASFRGLLQRLIRGQHRWAFLTGTGAAGTVTYAVLAFVLVGEGHGLGGLVVANVAQEVVLDVTLAFGARRAITPRGLRPLPWAETRELLHYASRVQIAEVASSFNIEIDALVVAAIFPLRYVAFYSIGSNFATQLIGVPVNAIPPIAVSLSRAFGRAGARAALEVFPALQRGWVRAVAAVPLVGAAAAYFGIWRWLGPGERLAGVVAVVLLAGRSTSLWSAVMDSLGKSINRPGIESAYLGLGMAVNVVVTVPLALSIGMLGVPVGTAVAETASRLYLLRLSRRAIDPDLRSYLADLPLAAIAAGAAVTLALEVPTFLVAPPGPAGLIVCGIPAALGIAAYVLVLRAPGQRSRGVGTPGARTRGAPGDIAVDEPLP